mmetsp:Transcript_98749/g.318484  ORF Transcript_98749/g.318484 Transcript_98749/m.318484 type:complete len:338 (+) Transcript_98749:179-1192(+)
MPCEDLRGCHLQVWPLLHDTNDDCCDVTPRPRMTSLLEEEQGHAGTRTSRQSQQGILQEGAVEVEVGALAPLHAAASDVQAQAPLKLHADGLPGRRHLRGRRAVVAEEHAVQRAVATWCVSAARSTARIHEPVHEHACNFSRAGCAWCKEGGAEAHKWGRQLHLQARHGPCSARHRLCDGVARPDEQRQEQHPLAFPRRSQALQPPWQCLCFLPLEVPRRDTVSKAGGDSTDLQILTPLRGLCLQRGRKAPQRQRRFRLQGPIVHQGHARRRSSNGHQSISNPREGLLCQPQHACLWRCLALLRQASPEPCLVGRVPEGAHKAEELVIHHVAGLLVE